jgi:hypothetical protein
MPIAPGRWAEVERNCRPDTVQKYALEAFVLLVKGSKGFMVIFIKLGEPSCKCPIRKFGDVDKGRVAEEFS